MLFLFANDQCYLAPITLPYSLMDSSDEIKLHLVYIVYDPVNRTYLIHFFAFTFCLFLILGSSRKYIFVDSRRKCRQ